MANYWGSIPMLDQLHVHGQLQPSKGGGMSQRSKQQPNFDELHIHGATRPTTPVAGCWNYASSGTEGSSPDIDQTAHSTGNTAADSPGRGGGMYNEGMTVIQP